MTVFCARCKYSLAAPGAVVLGPPVTAITYESTAPGSSVVEKLHLCRGCWVCFQRWLTAADAAVAALPPTDAWQAVGEALSLGPHATPAQMVAGAQALITAIGTERAENARLRDEMRRIPPVAS